MAMTEQEWLASTSSQELLNYLYGQGSERKKRLLACACCRSIWRLLHDERSRTAVQRAEAFADGMVALADLEKGRMDADDAVDESSDRAEEAARIAAQESCWPQMHGENRDDDFALHVACDAAHATCNVATEFAAQAPIVRDIFGNPFRPVTVNPTWRTSNVTTLAQSIYDDRAFDRLPILADALEDAGCDNADILNHCRQPGEHVRGCWIVDLLLGKE
jgi:hypothetical protein